MYHSRICIMYRVRLFSKLDGYGRDIVANIDSSGRFIHLEVVRIPLCEKLTVKWSVECISKQRKNTEATGALLLSVIRIYWLECRKVTNVVFLI